MKKVIILFALVTTIFANYQHYNPFIPRNKQYKKETSTEPKRRTPFPECLFPGSKSKGIDATLNRQLQREVESLFYANNYLSYSGQPRQKTDAKSVAAAAAAIKLTRDIMTILACDLNGTNSENLNKFLGKFTMPQEFCSYREKIDCDGKRKFRTSDGTCNNIEYPYRGTAKTAFGRKLDADYDDYLSAPRKTSRYGEPLPSCRKISLALDSQSIYNTKINHFFAMFGQFLANDMSIPTSVTETDSPISSPCHCDSKNDWERCNVIDVEIDDPYLGSQGCMAFPATAQAFKDQICSFGVKEQMNGNTHLIDLSSLYGSSMQDAAKLRSNNGRMKASSRRELKYELPPNQLRPGPCSDATFKQPCFAGGDPRMMENLLLTGINAMFIRFHNQVAKKVAEKLGDVSTHRTYEIARQFTIDLYQSIVYGYWVPKLIGPKYSRDLLNSLTTNGYNKSVTPVVYNEVATAALNLYSLFRDKLSRYTPTGKRIDQLSYLSISHKAKYAYDLDNNGIDSILCGSLYDQALVHDGNFAAELHHRFLESKGPYGSVWRNDIAAISICRGREHGIQGYNAYRQHCKLPKAKSFNGFKDTISAENIKRLREIYQHPDDVDLFVGLHLEDPVEDGVVGPVSACLLAEQFQVLCEGDRFCALHRYGLSKQELQNVSWTGLAYLVCKTVDVQKIPLFPFRRTNDINNPLIDCTIFKDMDSDFIDKVISLVDKPIGATNKLSADFFGVNLEEYSLKPGFLDYFSS